MVPKEDDKPAPRVGGVGCARAAGLRGRALHHLRRPHGVRGKLPASQGLSGLLCQNTLLFGVESLDFRVHIGLFSRLCRAYRACRGFWGGFGGVLGGVLPEAFARVHAVNYIHANDPCPRAWGALDLRRFVEVAAACSPLKV